MNQKQTVLTGMHQKHPILRPSKHVMKKRLGPLAVTLGWHHFCSKIPRKSRKEKFLVAADN